MPNQVDFDLNGIDELIGGSPETGESSPTIEQTVEIPDRNIPENNTQEDSKQGPEEPSNQEPENIDYISSFLSEYGIQDGKVTYENEDGSTEEVSFNDLDNEEKLNILKEITSPNLSKEEIETINYLRRNRATIQDVIEYYSQKAVNDYIQANGEVKKQYSVDEYSDDELYLADIKSKFEDMTDEEYKADLETAKENEELFKKKVDSIRKQYKAREEQEIQEQAKKQEETFNNFKSSLETQLTDFNEISMDYKDNKADRLQIEDSEKEEIYKYILDRDENGASQFFKDLNDPKMLVKLAWFALYGEDAISNISNYWKSQLRNARKEDKKSVTTVTKQDQNGQRDNFFKSHRSVETFIGDNLL